MSKKKACFNTECSDCKKTKYKASETLCPVCRKELDWVCAGKGCFKLIPKTEKYCPVCQAEINDTMEKAWGVVKTVGGIVGGIVVTVCSVMIGKEISKKD